MELWLGLLDWLAVGLLDARLVGCRAVGFWKRSDESLPCACIGLCLCMLSPRLGSWILFVDGDGFMVGLVEIGFLLEQWRRQACRLINLLVVFEFEFESTHLRTIA